MLSFFFSSSSSSSSSIKHLQGTLTVHNRYTSDFQEVRRVGRGGFGTVFEARHRLVKIKNEDEEEEEEEEEERKDEKEC